ncbi:hypothetical protein KY312_00085 [Candidatus Woesearchaeota archaeon]|nr:hypothetical protein [Candidatus Woesearchaeota archaeon]
MTKEKLRKLITDDGKIDPKYLIDHFNEIRSNDGLCVSIDPDTRTVYEQQQYTLESHLATKKVGLVEKGENYIMLLYVEKKNVHHFYLDILIENGGLHQGHLAEIANLNKNEYEVASVQMSKVVHTNRGLRVINEYVDGMELHDLAKLKIDRGDWLHIKATGHDQYETAEAYELVCAMKEYLQHIGLVSKEENSEKI